MVNKYSNIAIKYFCCYSPIIAGIFINIVDVLLYCYVKSDLDFYSFFYSLCFFYECRCAEAVQYVAIFDRLSNSVKTI